MVFGKVLSKLESINAITADEKVINFKNNFQTRVGFILFGVPHIGLRLRARNILDSVKLKEGMKIFDAGCGTGIYSFTLAKNNKIIGVDVGKDKIEYLKSVNIFDNVSFEVGDLCKLKFPDNSFDLIICSDVLEHIKDDKKAFKELSRVLNFGGKLLITTPKDSEFMRSIYKKLNHERPGYLKEDFEKLCQDQNMTILKAKYFSSNFSEELVHFLAKFVNNKIALGILFYPLYSLALLSEHFVNEKNSNGLFIEITKTKKDL